MRLAELRKKAGLSQGKLAQGLGISQNAVSQYENGTREPTLAKLKELADFFGVSVDYLLGDDNDGTLAVISQDDLNKAIEDNEKLKVATRAFDLIMSMPPEMQKAAIVQLQALAALNQKNI